jgi:hypothetical protein
MRGNCDQLTVCRAEDMALSYVSRLGVSLKPFHPVKMEAKPDVRFTIRPSKHLCLLASPWLLCLACLSLATRSMFNPVNDVVQLLFRCISLNRQMNRLLIKLVVLNRVPDENLG